MNTTVAVPSNFQDEHGTLNPRGAMDNSGVVYLNRYAH
jgi:hypothetical protein